MTDFENKMPNSKTDGRDALSVEQLRDRVRTLGGNVKSFTAYARAARTRADELRAKLKAGVIEPVETAKTLALVHEELGVVQEELDVADEELRQQNDELIRARHAAEGERHRYLDLFDAAPDPYIVTDRHGIIREANRAAALAVQMTAAFLVGKPLVNFVARSDCKKLRAAIKQLAEVERIDRLELRIRPRQHKPIFLAEMTATTIRNIRGATVSVRWQMRDVTPRTDLLAGENDHGPAVVVELRARLHQLMGAHEEMIELLRAETEARKAAEKSSSAKDEFLATVSHELRAPLTAILGWAHLLRADRLDATTQAQALDTIERNAQAQAKLISDLLEASRIITGKLRLARRSIGLRSVLHTAVDGVRLAAEAKALILLIDAADCEVSGDADRIEQILLNLLSNAIKFTPAGGQVLVSLAREGDFARLVIRDSGVGISADFLPYVFDRYRQAEDTTTRANKGLGLGLGIVQHLVELHKGRVDVASEGPGKGSTFSVYLPLITLDDAQAPIGNEPDLPPAEELPVDSSDVHGIRVLVVEDEADARDLLRTLLKQSGSDVASASCVSDALHLIETWDPDVLLSDIGMPDEDGYSLIQKVRARAGSRLLPAIAVTAYAKPEDAERALAAGFQMHIAKPVKPNTLLRAISNVARIARVENAADQRSLAIKP